MVAQVILIVFLISVGVMEVILRHDDRGKLPAPDRNPGQEKSGTSSADVGSLQALAHAVQKETPVLSASREATAGKEDGTREYNREDARSK